MILYTDYDLKIIPVFGDSNWAQIDRVQNVDKTGTINKIKVEEVGNPDVVGYVDQPPTIGYRLTQLEYGTLDFWEKLANTKNVNSVELSDFRTSAFDICAYLTDDDGTFKGTIWLPKLRLSGFAINIPDPNGVIERSFDFAGEDWIHWQGNNQYLIYKEEEIQSGEFESGDTMHLAVVNTPTAVADPDNPDTYILRVVRVRSGTATELTAGTDYYYEHADGELLVYNGLVGDVIKYWYTATTYISGQNPFTPNTSDLPGIHASYATITIESSGAVNRLQTVTVDVRLDRQDLFEIGNTEVVQRGIRNKTVTITLGRLFEDSTIEEVLRVKSSDYGKLDIRKFGDEFKVKIKIFEDSTKSTFKIGYVCTKLAPSEIRGGTAVDAYQDAGDTLVGEAWRACDNETTFDAI